MQRNPILDVGNHYATKVCNRLRVLREKSGLTAPDVAERLNMPTALYVLYEENELVPHRLIPPLCELLNMSPWFYLTGKSDEYSPPFRFDD
jgi:transcriptional regulator with XRE-family HTH domain